MKTLLILSISIPLLFSCASKEKKEIETEKKSVSHVSDREDLHERMREIIDSSQRLTEKQKQDFLTLHDNVIGKTDKINQDIRKLKVVLFNNLIQEKYDVKKVNEVKRQLKKLNDQKFNTMMEAMSDARDILGVNFKEIYPRAEFRENFHGRY